MAEIITDLANDILSCVKWNPKVTHSPHHNIIPEPIHLHEEEPFMPAQPADVVVDPSPHGMVDGYIDDLIPVVLDINDNAARGA